MLVVPLDSRLTMLDLLTPQLSAYCHLFRNDLTPGWWTQKADLQEMDADGYAPLALLNWSASFLSGPFALSQADPVVFIPGSGGPARSAFGYYYTRFSDGVLLAVERFESSPIAFDPDGPGLVIIPRLQLRTQQEVTSEPALPTVAGGGVEVAGDLDIIAG